jgi:cytochrome c-type biogenesis protein CcmF
MAVPLFLVLILLMGLGPALPWGSGDPRAIRRALLVPIPAAAVGLLVAFLLGGRSWPFLAAGAFAGYTLWVTFDQASRPARVRRRHGEAPVEAARRSILLAPRRLGAYTVHLGVLVVFVAIAISSTFQREGEANLTRGSSMELAGYTLQFREAFVDQQPHLERHVATIEVVRGGRSLGTLEPSLNFYPRERQPLGTPAVRTGPREDLYLTLMSVAGDGTSIGLRAIVTPAVVWIWLGAMLMVVGTVLCFLPARLAERTPTRVAVGEPVLEGEVGG